jgi:hypothetical protein
MKPYSALLGIFFLGLIIAACEKDDICVEGDTPLMIVTFHDKDDHTKKKAVENLSVTAKDKDVKLALAKNDSIAIPLKTSVDNTIFTFTKNFGSTDTSKPVTTDDVTFNYTVEEKFISRACGYVANYKDLETSFTNPGNWIEEIEIVTAVINLQNTTHVKIYH